MRVIETGNEIDNLEGFMELKDILSCIGGIALFLFGMTYMGDALKKRAGNKMKLFLSKVTKKPTSAFGLGLGLTTVIQSSTATNVMVLSFVNSGMMGLLESVPVTMGASLGTTITAWLISLSSIDGGGLLVSLVKPTSFVPVLCMIGVILYRFISNDKKKDVGSILIGFAILMTGMSTMSSSMSGLSSVPGFMSLFDTLSNPILGLLFGVALAAIMQSSSASVGVIQALALAGGITFNSVIPIIMGINIGQVVPVMIATTGTCTDARRVAFVDLFINLFGAIFALPVFMILKYTGNFPWLDVMAAPVTIAIMHSGYKALSCACELPAYRFFYKLVCTVVKDKKKDAEPDLLDARFLATPSLALAQCRQRVGECIIETNGAFEKAVSTFDVWDDDTASQVHDVEHMADRYQDEIDLYLSKLSAKSMTERESFELSYLMHVISDYENISDHIYHIVVSMKRVWDNDKKFGQDAMDSLGELKTLTGEILKLSEKYFYEKNSDTAVAIARLDQKISQKADEARNGHMKRLRGGSCNVADGAVFSDILLDFERISDHISKEARQNLFDNFKYEEGAGNRLEAGQ